MWGVLKRMMQDSVTISVDDPRCFAGTRPDVRVCLGDKRHTPIAIGDDDPARPASHECDKRSRFINAAHRRWAKMNISLPHLVESVHSTSNDAGTLHEGPLKEPSIRRSCK